MRIFKKFKLDDYSAMEFMNIGGRPILSISHVHWMSVDGIEADVGFSVNLSKSAGLHIGFALLKCSIFFNFFGEEHKLV